MNPFSHPLPFRRIPLVQRTPAGWCAALLATALMAVFSGCTTTETTPSATAETSESAPIAAPLKKGMSAEAVIELIGEPLERIPITDSRIPDGEEWVYRHLESRITGTSAAYTEEIPFVDPITQEMKTVARPVMVPETRDVHRIVHLYIIEGHLAGWKVVRREKHTLS